MWDDLAKWLDENLWDDSLSPVEEKTSWWAFIGVIILLLGIITFSIIKM